MAGNWEVVEIGQLESNEDGHAANQNQQKKAGWQSTSMAIHIILREIILGGRKNGHKPGYTRG